MKIILNKEDIEKVLKSLYNIDKIIWNCDNSAEIQIKNGELK